MRIVTWTDKDGYLHRALVRDTDPDTAGPRGVPLDPPDLGSLDWEGVRRDLHNSLVSQGIVSWRDLQRADNIKGLIVSVLKPRVIALFKQQVEET